MKDWFWLARWPLSLRGQGAHAGTLGNWLQGRPAPQPSQAINVQASNAEVQIQQQMQETIGS